jgi:tetratricopeptide (TPR) repeat protein
MTARNGSAVLLAIGLLIGCASDPEENVSYRSVKARIMNETGIKLHEEGNLKAALGNFNKALDHAMASDNREEAVRAHINIGQILLDQDLLDEAKAHFDAASRIAEDMGDDAMLYTTLQTMGGYLFRMERYGEAEAYFQEAYDIAEDLDSRGKQAMSLNDLGTVYQATGRTHLAVETLLEALHLFENLEGRKYLEGKGSVTNNLAAIREEQGRYADAWDLYTTGLACYQQLGDPEALFKLHTNMAGLLEHWGKKSDALLRYERAFGVAKEIPHRRWMEVSLENIVRLSKDLEMDYLHRRYSKMLEELREEVYGKPDHP